MYLNIVCASECCLGKFFLLRINNLTKIKEALILHLNAGTEITAFSGGLFSYHIICSACWGRISLVNTSSGKKEVGPGNQENC